MEEEPNPSSPPHPATPSVGATWFARKGPLPTVVLATLVTLSYATIREFSGFSWPPLAWFSLALALSLLAGLAARWMRRRSQGNRVPEQLEEELGQLEGALREAKANYRKIFENALEGFYQTTPEGQYVSANPALARLYKYESPEELIRERKDLNRQLYVDPKRRQEFAAVLEEHGEVMDFQSEVYCKDGSIIWIEESARAVRDREGKILCYEGSTQDITPRKRAIALLMQTTDELEKRVKTRTLELDEVIVALREEVEERRRVEGELRAIEERLHTVVSNAPLALWSLDANGQFTFLEGRGLGPLGLTSGHWVGRHVSELQGEMPRLVQDSLNALQGESIISHCEVNGRHFDTWFTPVYAGADTLRGVIGTAIDVTEAHQVQERLHLLESVVVNANDSIVITDSEPINSPGPRIIYANEAFCKSTGYGLEEVLNRSPRFLQGHETDRQTLALVRSALEHRIAIRVELINYRKNGTPYWVDLSLVPVISDAGWCTHWISVQRDITLQKGVEEELRRASEEAEVARRGAERANLAKSEFLSRMSHELRTPLNAILGFTQLLELDDRPVQERRNIEYILKAGQHLLQLINEVLDITRIETGQVSFSIETVQVSEVVQEVMELMNPLAARRSITVGNNLGTKSLYVLADRQRLRQVFLNLLSNAVKYNREGGHVWITCELVPGEVLDTEEQEDAALDRQGQAPRFSGAAVYLRVTDDGPGVPEEKLDRLFVPFDRLGAEHTAVEGTGIGLALTRHLVEAMGGEISVKSKMGEGTTFSFRLPSAPSPEVSLELEDGLLSPARDWDEEKLVAQRTVLYIEDNLVNLNLVESILEHRPHYRLLAAMQGGIGLDLAREHLPDLILLDLHLPDMGGDEVLRQLKEDANTREIPVIVLSADASPGRIDRLIAAGALTYLTKPLVVRQFLFTLEELLDE